VLSGFPANVSGRIILSEKAQPTTNVSYETINNLRSMYHKWVKTYADDIPLASKQYVRTLDDLNSRAYSEPKRYSSFPRS
jgi:hypothetical protein